MTVGKKTQWHPAFCSAMELELSDNREDLIFNREYNLSSKPLQIDLLVIEKYSGVKIRNEIGRLFRKYNVIEYKGPGNSLTIDTLYKIIGYACLYKGLGKEDNVIPANELTITIVRWSLPSKLFKQLKNSGYKIESTRKGIYYIKGIIDFPIQIVVLRLVNPKTHFSLRMLTNNVTEEEARAFLQRYRNVKLQGDKDNVDAVLQVGVVENINLFSELRGDREMCEALRELMKDDIEQIVNIRVEEAVKEAVMVAEADKKAALAEKDAEIADQKAKIAYLQEQLAAKK